MVRKKAKKEVFIERCLSEGGTRAMVKYLRDNLGHTIISAERPKEDDEEGWYIITYTKNEEKTP